MSALTHTTASQLPFEPQSFELDVMHAVDEGESLLVTAPDLSVNATVAAHAIGRSRQLGRSLFYASPNEALAVRLYRLASHLV